MTSLFEVIASTEDPAAPRAVIAAQTRAKTTFDRYLSQGNREARLAQIDDDIRKMAKGALRHRLILNFEAEADRVSPDDLVQIGRAHV